MYCDNKSAVDTVNRLKNYKINLKTHLSPNMDIIKGIIEGIKTVKSNNGYIKLRHIRGHQDRHNKYVEGNAALNVEADNLATKGLLQPSIKDFNLPTDQGVLILNGKKIASHYIHHLREKYSATQMFEYYKETYKWSDNTIAKIWWESHGSAIRCFGPDQKITLLKFIHSRSACNKRESTYYAFRSPLCHTCGLHVEDHCHIIKCTACPARNNLRKKYMSEIKDKMHILGTNSDTIRVISSFLSSWLNDTAPVQLKEIMPDASEHMHRAIEEQRKIGWNQWFRGRISNTWGDMYSYDMKNTTAMTKYPSVNRWGKEVIVLTMKFILDCWYIRNKNEHHMEEDPIARLKTKLIEEILWIRDIVDGKIPAPLKEIKYEELIELPKENLLLMLEQLKNLKGTK
jgi:hypothetical protein